ncbi:MAG: polyketide cyclase / dehydrase and lipid transport [Dactylosporangium sp.]|jgi:hypothetical protein|nr:polyketide cyclase / dehydrase and lipid transport [Dactylosporangium sp.]
MVTDTAHLVVTATVPGSPASVRAWCCDIANLGLVHPLIVGVRQLGQTVSHDGTTVTDYLVTDRMAVGGLRMRFTYRVRVSAPEQGPIGTEARQFPLIRLRSEISFVPAEGGTLVREQLAVRAPRPLLRFVTREAERAHSRMYAAMGRLFTGGPS